MASSKALVGFLAFLVVATMFFILAGMGAFSKQSTGQHNSFSPPSMPARELPRDTAESIQSQVDFVADAPIPSAKSEPKIAEKEPFELKTQLDCTKSRSFVDDAARSTLRFKIPPALWSLPGSGDTMVRMMIEAASGYHTGSVYGDKMLKDMMPGEVHCDNTVIGIKVHPGYRWSNSPFDFQHLFQIPLKKLPNCPSIATPLPAAVMILRHPLHAFWAEFVRRKTGSRKEYMPKSKFQMSQFRQVLTNELIEMWRRVVVQAYQIKMQELPHVEVRFEALTSSSIRDRVMELNKVMKFLGLKNVSMNELQCAVEAADDPEFAISQPDNPSQVMTMEDAYKAENFVCEVWKHIRSLTIPLGYTLPEAYRSACQEEDFSYT